MRRLVASGSLLLLAQVGCSDLLDLDHYEVGRVVAGSVGGAGAGGATSASTGGGGGAGPSFFVELAKKWNGTGDLSALAAPPGGGRIYATGSFQGAFDIEGAVLSSSGMKDIFVAALGDNLAPLWKPRSYGGSTGDDEGLGIAASTTDVWVVGSIFGAVQVDTLPVDNPSGPGGLVARFPSDGGGTTFAQPLIGPGFESPHGVALTSNFMLFGGLATGQVSFWAETLQVTQTGLFVGGVDSQSAGHLVWGAGDGGTDELLHMATLPTGEWAAATGFFDGAPTLDGTPTMSQGMADAFVTRLDNTGHVVWRTVLGGPADTFASRVAVAADGTVVVVGDFRDTMTIGDTRLTSMTAEPDVFVAKLDAMGAPLWATSFRGAGDDGAAGVAVDEAGNIYVVGSASAGIDVGGGLLRPSGGVDGYVASLGPAGEYRWSFNITGPGDQRLTAAAMLDPGHLVVGGYFSNELDYPGGQLISGNERDVFLLKIALE